MSASKRSSMLKIANLTIVELDKSIAMFEDKLSRDELVGSDAKMNILEKMQDKWTDIKEFFLSKSQRDITMKWRKSSVPFKFAANILKSSRKVAIKTSSNCSKPAKSHWWCGPRISFWAFCDVILVAGFGDKKFVILRDDDLFWWEVQKEMRFFTTLL